MIFSTKLTASAVAATALLASVGDAAPATPMSKFNKRDLRFNFGQDKVRGVNLGGWLNTEPFIAPDLYEPFYPNAVDEFTLSQLLANSSSGLQAQLEQHYATFIVSRLTALVS